MTSAIQPALRQRIRETTVQAILTAAEEVFANNGLHAAHMGEIASLAGVAVGTLYNHFADRDALLAGLLEARRDELLARIDDGLRGTPKAIRSATGCARSSRVLTHKEQHRRFFHILMQGEMGATKRPSAACHCRPRPCATSSRASTSS
jgi:AcrR family transcriptional regulator